MANNSLNPPSSSQAATLSLPTALTARQHLGSTKKSETRHVHPGYSMFDWNRFCDSGRDLSGVGGRLISVSPEELAKHCTEDDAWTVVRGRVYNITPFMKFHPGGKKQLMRGAGIDCTELFDKIHVWVNSESILKRCIVGTYKGELSKAEPPSSNSLRPDVMKPQEAATSGEDQADVITIAIPVPTVTGPPASNSLSPAVTQTPEEKSNDVTISREEMAGVTIALPVPTVAGGDTQDASREIYKPMKVPDKITLEAASALPVIPETASIPVGNVQSAPNTLDPVTNATILDLEQRMRTVELQVKRLTETVVNSRPGRATNEPQGNGFWYVLTIASWMMVPLVVAFVYKRFS